MNSYVVYFLLFQLMTLFNQLNQLAYVFVVAADHVAVRDVVTETIPRLIGVRLPGV